MHYLEALRLARRHRIADMQIEIAVNYASLMQELGNPRDALNLLKRYEPGFPRQREPYVCYQVLADLCAENGDTAGALKYWLSGQVWATSLENADYIAICSAGISDIYEYEHKYNLAAKELERAMMYEHEPEGQATLVDLHTPKANVQCTTLDRKPLKSVRNRHQTNTILNTSHEPKSTTVLELKYRSYEMFTIIQEFTEKYRGFRGSLFSIHP